MQGGNTAPKGIYPSNLNVKKVNCQKVLCSRNKHVQSRKGMDFENYIKITAITTTTTKKKKKKKSGLFVNCPGWI